MDKNMKIVVLTTYFWPEENGLTRYIDGLYSNLLKSHPDVEVDVIAFDTLKTGKYFEKYKKFSVYRIKCVPILGRTYAFPTIKGLRQLKKIFKEKKYNAINTHTRFFLTSFFGIRLGKKYSIPVVHTEHGSGFVRTENRLVNGIAKIFDITLGKYVLKNAKIVCGVSESVCVFAKKLGAKKTAIVYNGIVISFWDKAEDRQKIREELKIDKGDEVISFVGRQVPSKGCQDLIQALAGIDLAGWKLLVVGDGFFERKLKKTAADLGLSEKVIFLGHQNPERIRDIFQAADLFVNPSLASEGLPTTLLEASTAGCRCLSSDKGGSVEVLGKENIYPAGDIESLREKISNYKKLPMADVRQFDWEQISEKFYSVLKQA